jgi:hypothetical protein
MKTPSYVLICAAVLLACVFGTLTAFVQQPPSKTPHAAAGDVEHGRYLVEEVAKCAECHTPRDAQGNLEAERWLQGAQTWISPVHPMSNWAENAPPIAGFSAYTDADAVSIFEKGIGPNGTAIRPPMHIYHMSHEDTMAIVAYLRSLPARPQ